jgi:uncharacterized protein (DUF2147 family)
MKKSILLFIALIAVAINTNAQTSADAILGEWLTKSKDGKILIYKEGNQYFGKITGGNSTNSKDENNPDEKLRGLPLIGKIILTKFVFNGKSKWEDGQIYDPNNGKTYSCIIKLKNANELEVRGYVGISLIGRTEVWCRIK